GVTRRPLPNTTGVLPVQASSRYYIEYDVGGGALLVTGSRGTGAGSRSDDALGGRGGERGEDRAGLGVQAAAVEGVG
ncbi:hypothetical protein QWJ41_21505, partial [Nocardioides sp. SOB44]